MGRLPESNRLPGLDQGLRPVRRRDPEVLSLGRPHRPTEGRLAEIYHHEKEEWYDREECGINACAVYLLTRSAKEALVSRHLTGRADPDYTQYLTPPELWLIMTVFRDDHQKLALAPNIWIKYLRLDVRQDQVRALLDNNLAIKQYNVLRFHHDAVEKERWETHGTQQLLMKYKRLIHIPDLLKEYFTRLSENGEKQSVEPTADLKRHWLYTEGRDRDRDVRIERGMPLQLRDEDKVIPLREEANLTLLGEAH